MAHYAKVVNGVVTEVLVAEASFFDTFVDSSPGQWVQTSYNTHAGQHKDGGTPLRGNFAGVGFVYDADEDAFYEPKPYESWTLNTTTYQWEPPVARPDSGSYEWNETTQTWDAI